MSQGVQITVDEDDVSTVVIGETRVEVSDHGKRVTAYTEHGVETRPASGEAPAKGTQFSISDDFKTVVVNGVTIECAADGHLVISSSGTVITKPGPANDSAAKAPPEIGDEMADGTIYAGISPDTHKPMFAKPKDESGTYTFNEAAKHAKNVGDGFHVPTKNELNVLYENRNKGKLKGTFNETGSNPAGWYWSSSPFYDIYAWAQRFSDGFQSNFGRYDASSLRLVK